MVLDSTAVALYSVAKAIRGHQCGGGVTDFGLIILGVLVLLGCVSVASAIRGELAAEKERSD
jgi:hypothetical protein